MVVVPHFARSERRPQGPYRGQMAPLVPWRADRSARTLKPADRGGEPGKRRCPTDPAHGVARMNRTVARLSPLIALALLSGCSAAGSGTPSTATASVPVIAAPSAAPASWGPVAVGSPSPAPVPSMPTREPSVAPAGTTGSLPRSSLAPAPSGTWRIGFGTIWARPGGGNDPATPRVEGDQVDFVHAALPALRETLAQKWAGEGWAKIVGAAPGAEDSLVAAGLAWARVPTWLCSKCGGAVEITSDAVWIDPGTDRPVFIADVSGAPVLNQLLFTPKPVAYPVGLADVGYDLGLCPAGSRIGCIAFWGDGSSPHSGGGLMSMSPPIALDVPLPLPKHLFGFAKSTFVPGNYQLVLTLNLTADNLLAAFGITTVRLGYLSATLTLHH